MAGLSLGLRLGLSSAGAGTPFFELLIVAGQSNAISAGTDATAPPAGVQAIDPTRVLIWDGTEFVGYDAGVNSDPNTDTGQWGPEAEYARLWLANHARGTLYIVKRPVSGTAIATWVPGTGTNYENLQSWYDAAAVPSMATNVIWCQGESDSADAELAAAYEAQLELVVAGFRSDFGASKIGIAAHHDWGPAQHAVIRAAQNDVASSDGLIYLVETDDLTLMDAVHFDSDSVIVLGQRMYEAITQGDTIEVHDSTPAAFSFTDVTDATLSTEYTSAAVTVSGINVAVPISVSGGTYSVNDGAFTSAAGTVSDGDTVKARVTSSASNSTAVSAIVTIGGVSDTYSVTTEAEAGQDADAAVLFARWGTDPGATRKGLYDDFFVGLKADSVYADVDVMYVLAAHGEADAKLEIKSNSAYDLVAAGTPTFTADSGFTGNGTDSILATSYDPLTLSLGMTQDDTSIFVWIMTTSASTAWDVHAANSRSRIRPRQGTFNGSVSGGTASTGGGLTMPAPPYFAGIIRRDSGNVYPCVNGAVGTATASTSLGLPTAFNILGLTGLITDRKLAFVAFAKGLSDAKALALYTRTQTLLTGIGAI